MLRNPFWRALRSEHANFAVGNGLALRYPPNIIPFAALEDNSATGANALARLLSPDEAIYIAGDVLPDGSSLVQLDAIPGWQMQLVKLQDGKRSLPQIAVESLSAPNSASMVELTDVAFPGFFRPETYKLGRYFGIRINGELVAMAGERLATPGVREISAVCTHPAHLGRGYAAAVIYRLVELHQSEGITSILHVAAANERAIRLYERLGFEKTGEITFFKVGRA